MRDQGGSVGRRWGHFDSHLARLGEYSILPPPDDQNGAAGDGRMMHWCDQYRGAAWTPECDCFAWFRYWRQVHFGDQVPDVHVDRRYDPSVAMGLITADMAHSMGWEPTSCPAEGDAVTLSRGQSPHHIGMVVVVAGRRRILHAAEGAGVLVSSPAELFANHWIVTGYWTPCK